MTGLLFALLVSLLLYNVFGFLFLARGELPANVGPFIASNAAFFFVICGIVALLLVKKLERIWFLPSFAVATVIFWLSVFLYKQSLPTVTCFMG